MDVDLLREKLHYDPVTGTFTHIRLKRIVGTTLANGMAQISLLNKRYYAHRLAWLYMTGAWPKGFLDHKDRNPTNNRFSNLRESTPGENSQNTDALGITKHPNGLWLARIMVHGKTYRLGYHKTSESAREAYIAAKRRLHHFYYEDMNAS